MKGDDVRDVVAELRFPPSIRQVGDETFEVSRNDLQRLLQARTKAANLIERELAELRGRGAGPLAVDEGAQAKPVAWMWPTMGGMQTATNPLNVPAHAKPLYAHPSVSAGERAQLGHDPYSVIVRTAKGADVEAFIAFVEKAGGSVRHRLTAISALGVDLPHGWPFEMVAKIVKHPAVRDVQTNHYMRICSPDSAVLPAPTEPAK